MSKLPSLIASVSLLVACTGVEISQDRSLAGDEANFGAAEDHLFWTFEQKVAGFRNMDRISWVRHVPAAGNPYPLPRDESDLN